MSVLCVSVVRDELSDTDDHELLDIVEKMEHDAEGTVQYNLFDKLN
jgi:hypothetical protein